MARKLTAREALGESICQEFYGVGSKLRTLSYDEERGNLNEASRHIRRLKRLGFAIVPCKPSRKGRKA